MCDANSGRTGARVERLRMGLSFTDVRSALLLHRLMQARTYALFERDPFLQVAQDAYILQVLRDNASWMSARALFTVP